MSHGAQDKITKTTQSPPFTGSVSSNTAKTTTGRKTYQKGRSEDFRLLQGNQRASTYENELRRRLLPGLKNLTVTGNENRITIKNTNLTTTTRRFGFSVHQIYRGTTIQKNVPYDICPIYSMYRVGLALFEAKHLMLQRDLSLILENQQSIYRFEREDENFLAVIKSVTEIPAPIASIINTIGIVKDGIDTFVPIFQRDYEAADGRFVPLSERVTLSNMRRTVVYLSDQNNPPEIRRSFYRNNPLPGASWIGAPLNPVLEVASADNLMPHDYSLNSLRSDVNNVKLFMRYLFKKTPALRSTVSFGSEGRKGLFVSNEQNGLRLPDLQATDVVDDEITTSYYKKPIEGNIHTFWAMNQVSWSSMMEGAINLLGEVPDNRIFRRSAHLPRYTECAREQCTLDHRAALEILDVS